MKKLISFCILYFVTLSVFSQSCPEAKQLFVRKSDGSSVVKSPPGWVLVTNNRPGRATNYEFLLAAWGDHQHSREHVRCHYYIPPHMDGHIQLVSQDLIEESKIISNPNWSSLDNTPYHLCKSDSHSVDFCSFN